jgi:hypothetical protein
MDEKIIDLSGLGGYADGFYGDIDMVTSQPHMRTNWKDGQLAEGLFNPYIRKGYLFPVSTSKTTVTTSDAISSRLSSSVVDNSLGVVWAADQSGQVFKLDDLTDTSLTLTHTLYTNSTSVSQNDLEIYQIDGTKKLFSTTVKSFGLNSQDYKGISQLTGTTGLGVSVGMAFPSVDGLAQPSLYDNSVIHVTTAGTSITESLSVDPAGANQIVVALVTSPNSMGGTTATYGGVAMTQLASGSSASYGYYKFYYLKNPPTGSNTINISTTASVSDKMLMVMSLNDVKLGSFTNTSVDLNIPSASGSYVHNEPTIKTEASIYYEFISTDASYVNHLTGQESVTSQSFTGTSLNYKADISSVDISKKVLQVATFSDTGVLEEEDWMYPNTSSLSSNPAGGFLQLMNSDWSFIRKSGNGFAYLFAENAVHKIDGTKIGGETGTITKNVLLFPETFRLIDAVDFNSKMYIGVHEYTNDTLEVEDRNFVGECGILVWNRISTQFNSTNYIRLPGVKEIKKIYASPDGVIKLITISNSGIVQLRQFGYNDSGGVVFPVIKELGIGAFPQTPEGVTNYGDKTAWIANDGNMYVEKSGAITSLFDFKADANTSSGTTSNMTTGSLTFASGVETADVGYRANKQGLIASFNDGSARVYKIYPLDLKDGSNTEQTPHIGNVYTGVTYLPITGDVERVRIYNLPTATNSPSAAATVKLYFNQRTTPDMVKTVSQAEATRGYVDFNISTPYLHAIQLEIEWETGIVLGDDTYAPSIAVVSYKKTEIVSPDNG